MTKQRLDRPKIGPVGQHMRGERMAQSMGRDLVDAEPFSIVLQNQPEPLARQPLAAMVQEQGVVALLVAAGKLWSADVVIFFQCGDYRPAERQDPCTATAVAAHDPPGQPDSRGPGLF